MTNSMIPEIEGEGDPSRREASPISGTPVPFIYSKKFTV